MDLEEAVSKIGSCGPGGSGTWGGGGRQTWKRRRRIPVHGGREGAERLETERKRETDRGVARLAWFGRRWHSAEGRSGEGEEDGRGRALRWLACSGTGGHRRRGSFGSGAPLSIVQQGGEAAGDPRARWVEGVLVGFAADTRRRWWLAGIRWRRESWELVGAIRLAGILDREDPEGDMRGVVG